MTKPLVLDKIQSRVFAQIATEENVVVAVRRGDLVIEFKPAAAPVSVPKTLDEWRDKKGK